MAPAGPSSQGRRGGRRMSLRLHNTLTRQVEPFVAAHAGAGVALHLRAHDLQLRPHREFPDVPLRGPPAPLAGGERVRGLPHHEPHRRGRPDHRRGAPRRGSPSGEHVDPFARAFEEDRDWLRIRPAHAQPRATEYIGPMIELIQGLLDEGRGLQGRRRLGLLRHRAVPGVRPALAARPARARGRGQRAGQRRRVRQGGRARLRALEGGRAGGRGGGRRLGRAVRPGAPGLAHRVLGHGAGADPAASGAPTCSTSTPGRGPDLPAPRGRDRPELRLHRARTSSPGSGCTASSSTSAATKMSKRYGNITTARDLREDGVDAGAVRLLMFKTHYRQKLDLTDEALAAAREGSRRLGEFQRPAARAARRRPTTPEFVEAAGAVPTRSSPRRWTTTSTRPRALGRALRLLVRRGTGCWTRAAGRARRSGRPGRWPTTCSP